MQGHGNRASTYSRSAATASTPSCRPAPTSATVHGNHWTLHLMGPTSPPCTGYPGSGSFMQPTANFQRLREESRPASFTAKYTQDLGFAKLTAIGDYQKLTKNYAEDSDTTPQTWFQFFNGSDVNGKSPANCA